MSEEVKSLPENEPAATEETQPVELSGPGGEFTAPAGFKSGFVSIVGRPNVGKSTLLNALLGMKLAIVADKPQTTRNNIQGVLTLPEAQIVFLDTPGIHKLVSELNRRMMEEVRKALEERDVLIFVVDATKPFVPEDEEAAKLIIETKTPTIVALNKIDRLKNKALLLPLIDRYRHIYDFQEYIPISALTGEGLDELRQALIKLLPEGPPYFPADYVTNQTERFLASEIIREKIIHLTRQEVPHSVAVFIEDWDEEDSLVRIHATIVVEKDGQKAIIIGAKGSMLKKIGTLARQELEALLGKKVYLELFVKVRPKWRNNPTFLRELDYYARAAG